jgi:hypothetical protein
MKKNISYFQLFLSILGTTLLIIIILNIFASSTYMTSRYDDPNFILFSQEGDDPTEPGPIQIHWPASDQGFIYPNTHNKYSLNAHQFTTSNHYDETDTKDSFSNFKYTNSDTHESTSVYHWANTDTYNPNTEYTHYANSDAHYEESVYHFASSVIPDFHYDSTDTKYVSSNTHFFVSDYHWDDTQTHLLPSNIRLPLEEDKVSNPNPNNKDQQVESAGSTA